MNLATTLQIQATSAGTGSAPALPATGPAERKTKRDLDRRQTKLNKTRKRGMPYPGGAFEDKKQLGAKIPVRAGGPGSGCQGPNCGRPLGQGYNAGDEISEDDVFRMHNANRSRKHPVPHGKMRMTRQWNGRGERTRDLAVDEKGNFFAISNDGDRYEFVGNPTRGVWASGPNFEVHNYDKPAPEDVKSIKERSYKSGMKKAKTLPRIPLNTPPGATPWQTIQGEQSAGDIQCFIRKEGGQYCVHSHQTGKNFGCYNSRPEAEHRLEQIKRFR